MTDLTDEQYADWMENADGGRGPTPTATFERADLETLLAAVKGRDHAEDQLSQAVAIVRARGASWSVIGSALGLSKQGAHKKYARRLFADSNR
ncbi:MAG: hypothetical protein LBG60_01040 [Bifidobacteriaceae bacterium]|jgi:hypothetical protein|nr:hypothetical protein [Bifidobacteriaceae bacterium]